MNETPIDFHLNAYKNKDGKTFDVIFSISKIPTSDEAIRIKEWLEKVIELHLSELGKLKEIIKIGTMQ